MSRWLKIFVYPLLVLVVVLVSLPWWFGLALRPILRARNITFERYEREGYAHFQLRNTTYQRDRVTVTIETLRAPTPMLWLAQWLGSGPALEAENWALKITANPGPPTPDSASAIHGPPDLRVLLHERVWPRLVRWLPHAQLKKGVLQGPGLNLTIANLTFDRGTLALTGAKRGSFEFNVTAVPGPDGSFNFTGSSAETDAKLQFVWSGAGFNGGGTVWDQPVQLSANFSARGWSPAELSATAEHWSLPAARLKLAAPYVLVQGDARFDWRAGAFTLAVDATADPAKDAKAPSFSAHATAHGTLRELTLTALDVNAPFATAKLTAPVTFSLDRPLAAESAELRVQADLAKLPWIKAQGAVKGVIRVNGDTVAARQTFELESSDVMLPGFTLQQARATGSLHWPLLELTTLEAQLDKTSRIDAHGSIDWKEREVTGVLQAKLGPSALSRWLPAGVTWETADIAAVIDGPLDAPQHHGSLKFAGLHWPPLKPVLLIASWQGTGAQANAWSARFTAARSSLELDGSLNSQRLKFDKIQLNTAAGLVWQLNVPARLTWSPNWDVEFLQLISPVSQLTFQGHGGPEASLRLALGPFESAWLQDWISLAGPAWQVKTLQFNGRIAEGMLVFDTTLTAQITLPSQPAQVKLVASGDAEGVLLKELTITDGDRVLTRATGRLPLTWHLQPTPHLQRDEDAPLEFSATTDPDSPLWAALAASTRLEFVRPEANISLSGTLRQPAGDFRLRAAKLAYTVEKNGASLPQAEDLNVAIHFDRTRFTITEFSAKLDGQAVSASGQLPMTDDAWHQLWQSPGKFDWSEAEGKLEIPDADLAPFARRAPNFIAALGRLRAQVTLSRGGHFSGELHILNASSRPLPLVGPLQEINANFALTGRTVDVRSLTARLGGEPVTVTGSIILAAGTFPHLDLSLKGTKLPLVRSAALLVRSDLDLQAKTNPAGVTRLTGTVRVRDSLALANFNSLLPTGLQSVTRVPPYFAVTQPPFSSWPLDIDVRGSRAIQVRTTVFNGTLSARFHLGGTLGEPRAVGDLSVDEGSVQFPFAAFKVQQGTLRLSEADPFHARINLRATSQRRDYQVRLDVTGLLPTPVVAMSSSPALDATDVLLMVMTGRPPSDGTASSSVQRLALLGAYLGRGVFEDLGFGGDDRLEISSGEQISAQGRETYELEYKLGERWSLVGEYDQYDSYNVDLKRRVFIQESTPPPDEKK